MGSPSEVEPGLIRRFQERTYLIWLLVKRGITLALPRKVVAKAVLVRNSVTGKRKRTTGAPNKTFAPELSQREKLKRVERKIYSQNGEDGIIHFIISKIASERRSFVEIGVEDGKECNTAALSINMGWTGLLVEGNNALAQSAKKYYECRTRDRVQVVSQYVTPENINELFTQQDISGDIDLFSLDIDSYDYWVWKALVCIQPRLVIIEFNSNFGPDRSVTIPYETNFSRFEKHYTGYYWGASLGAFHQLGKTKGYSLVGCDSSGANAFFVRDDLLSVAGLKATTPRGAYYRRTASSWREPPDRIFDRIRQLPLIRV